MNKTLDNAVILYIILTYWLKTISMVHTQTITNTNTTRSTGFMREVSNILNNWYNPEMIAMVLGQESHSFIFQRFNNGALAPIDAEINSAQNLPKQNIIGGNK